MIIVIITARKSCQQTHSLKLAHGMYDSDMQMCSNLCQILSYALLLQMSDSADEIECSSDENDVMPGFTSTHQTSTAARGPRQEPALVSCLLVCGEQISNERLKGTYMAFGTGLHACKS